jgi:hydrogenase assembly chaperone HypC/HupF
LGLWAIRAGVRRTVNIGLLDAGGTSAEPGDWVLIHVGFAMSKIDEAEAERALDGLKLMGNIYVDELEQIEKVKGEDLMRMMPTLNIQDPTIQKILPIYQEAVANEALRFPLIAKLSAGSSDVTSHTLCCGVCVWSATRPYSSLKTMQIFRASTRAMSS